MDAPWLALCAVCWAKNGKQFPTPHLEGQNDLMRGSQERRSRWVIGSTKLGQPETSVLLARRLAERVSPAVRDVVPITPVSEHGVRAYALGVGGRLSCRDEYAP